MNKFDWQFWINDVLNDKTTSLILRGKDIAFIPPEISKLQNLEELDISNNRISELPPEIAKLRNLKRLECSYNSLSTLPPEIGELTNLEYLDAHGNAISDLPSEIEYLQNLKELILGGQSGRNFITILPPGIRKLQNLRNLTLNNNLFSTLSPEIFDLINLQILNLRNNRIESIPHEIGRLKNLKRLDLQKNNLRWLPDEIGDLEELELLALDFNKLIELPATIGQLTELRTLRLRSNELSELPIQLLSLQNLSYLNIDANYFTVPPEFIEKPEKVKEILNFYFRQKEINKKRLLEAKLLVVGQGSVGKTSIVQQILYGTFDQNQTKTEGISINQWQISENDIRNSKDEEQASNNDSRISNIRLNIWDFGGQEIMHATRQFFLTKRSLYLLALDARLTQEENRVEYWLKIIQSFGGESPVLIVGNKTDQHRLDIDRTGLQKKYPNIVGILETSAATGAGIAALKAEIAKQVDTLPHVRDLLPETWFTVKSKLEELGRDKNFITQDEYLGLCAANDVTDETSQHTLIGFLHDLGVVLHFQDDPRLEALGILNPQWVASGVYKILNSHELFQNQGMLTLPILNKTLNPPEYPSNKRLFIVDMMKKFELCYDIEPDKSFLIPDLLPKNEIYTGEWDDALAFQYHYNVLPSSIITRFIVRMNAFIHKNIIWRSGVVLQNQSNFALIKADFEERSILIYISGVQNTSRDFLAMIRQEFESIHKTLAGIEVVSRIKHPTYPELILDYEELLEFERQGVNEFPRKVSSQIIKINVKELLNGIDRQGTI